MTFKFFCSFTFLLSSPKLPNNKELKNMLQTNLFRNLFAVLFWHINALGVRNFFDRVDTTRSWNWSASWNRNRSRTLNWNLVADLHWNKLVDLFCSEMKQQIGTNISFQLQSCIILRELRNRTLFDKTMSVYLKHKILVCMITLLRKYLLSTITVSSIKCFLEDATAYSMQLIPSKRQTKKIKWQLAIQK
jgi:hypothetical protein